MIQYPKTTHVTLPSVEGGFGTLNILRDPPKSIQTYYRPKVGDTSKLTELIDGSGDRVCEAINKYARGVNPMVAVNYSNYGTSGGQYRDRVGSSDSQQPLHSTQAYLPYRVNRDGAFRPPVIAPQALLPLSRLPRLPTSMTINSGSDYTRVDKLLECKTDLREVRKQLLKHNICPKVIFNLDRLPEAPLETKFHVKSALQGHIPTNKSLNIQSKDTHVSTPDKGIGNKVNTSAYTNVSTHVQKPLSYMEGIQPIHTKNTLIHSYTANASGTGDANKYIHAPKTLEKNHPTGSVFTNRCVRGVDLNGETMGRHVSLAPKIRAGGFSNQGFVPSTSRDNDVRHSHAPSNMTQQGLKLLHSR